MIQSSVIIDTDAGSDDLMAIAYLLRQPDVRIEAITVCNGLAHVQNGALNIQRLLELAGAAKIPIYCGIDKPLSGTQAFPEQWRNIADRLPGVSLPDVKTAASSADAVDFLERRLTGVGPPVKILALGPLTNLAVLLQNSPAVTDNIDELIVMGGAFDVPGNVFSFGTFKSSSDAVEWNIFVDPVAAKVVFETGINILVIPLDATNEVMIDASYFDAFTQTEAGTLGRVVFEILKTVEPYIDDGTYYAWDPLAAVAMRNRQVIECEESGIEVIVDGNNSGQTVAVKNGNTNIRIARHADRALFFKRFVEAFR